MVDPAALEQRIPATTSAVGVARASRLGEGSARPAAALPAGSVAQPAVLSALAERVYDWVAMHRLLLVSCPDGVCTLDVEPEPKPSTTRPAAWLRWPRRIGYALLAVVAAGAFATALPPSVSAYKLPEPFGPCCKRW